MIRDRRYPSEWESDVVLADGGTGEQPVDSSVAGMLSVTTPLWTLLVALIARQETQPSPTRLAGLVLGFGGTLLIFEPWQSGEDGGLGGELVCLAAAASYGLSYVYMARYLTPRHPSPFVLAYGQMVAAALLLVPALIVASRQPIDLDGSVAWSMIALGPIGTGIAYVVNYAIVAREGATVASTVTYLLPIVAVALGAAALDEPITAAMSAGTLVVLVGVALSRRSPERTSTEAVPR